MDEQKSKKLYVKSQGEAKNLLLKNFQIFPMKQRYRYMQYCLTKKFSTSERDKKSEINDPKYLVHHIKSKQKEQKANKG